MKKNNIASADIIILITSVFEIYVLECFTDFITKCCCLCNVYCSGCFLFCFFFFYIDLIRTVVAFYCLFSLSASRGLDNKLKYQEVIRNVFVTGSLYEIFTQIMEVFVFCFGWFYYIILS